MVREVFTLSETEKQKPNFSLKFIVKEINAHSLKFQNAYGWWGGDGKTVKRIWQTC